MKQAFDAIADEYDRWYDTPEGDAIFQAELKCLGLLHVRCPGSWLEVGVGTGRFACSLGITEGIDPSQRMLEIAANRGIAIHQGSAESLPFKERSFDGILMALTLCFVQNADQALKECLRVIRPGGWLLIGAVPSHSAWGRRYIEKASKGHPIYAEARFRTSAEIVRSVECAGFTFIDAASTLFWKPGDESELNPQVATGINPNAGFLGLLFEKSMPTPLSDIDPEGYKRLAKSK